MATTTGRGSNVQWTAVQAEVEAQPRAAAEAGRVVRDQVEELARPVVSAPGSDPPTPSAATTPPGCPRTQPCHRPRQ